MRVCDGLRRRTPVANPSCAALPAHQTLPDVEGNDENDTRKAANKRTRALVQHTTRRQRRRSSLLLLPSVADGIDRAWTHRMKTKRSAERP
jgi:hypothetical protein